LTEFLTENDSATGGLQDTRRTGSTRFWDVSSAGGPQAHGRTISGGLRIWRLGFESLAARHGRLKPVWRSFDRWFGVDKIGEQVVEDSLLLDLDAEPLHRLGQAGVPGGADGGAAQPWAAVLGG
jgi:hypothetical protein